MIEKKNNILRIDLDISSRKKAILFLQDRLSYLIHLNWITKEMILKIELNKKSSYGCKIYLNKYVLVDYIFKTQLLLGSDYRKECCAMINYYKLNMNYYDRLFTSKRYPNGKFKHSIIEDVTKHILFK